MRIVTRTLLHDSMTQITFTDGRQHYIDTVEFTFQYSLEGYINHVKWHATCTCPERIGGDTQRLQSERRRTM
jgi:hypothetical protein